MKKAIIGFAMFGAVLGTAAFTTEARAAGCSGSISGPSMSLGWGWGWQWGDPSMATAGVSVGTSFKAAAGSNGSRDRLDGALHFDTNAQFLNLGTFHPVSADVVGTSENGVQDNISFVLSVLGNPIFQRNQSSYTYTWVQNQTLVPRQQTTVVSVDGIVGIYASAWVDGEARLDITAASGSGPASLSLTATPSGAAVAKAEGHLGFGPPLVLDAGVQGSATLLRVSLPASTGISLANNEVDWKNSLSLTVTALDGSIVPYVDVLFGHHEFNPIFSWPAPVSATFPLLSNSSCVTRLNAPSGA